MASSPASLDTDTAPATVTIMGNAPPLWALIVGINKYALDETKDLQGAVGDANAVRSFLERELLVSPTQIADLRDEEATREGIIRAWCSLQTNECIRRGDPILIFYAGHGGQTQVSDGVILGEKIQCIIPHDYGVGGPGGGKPITDRVLGKLADDLAQVKGDNITIILDCCHSSSGTRTDEDDPTLLVRSIEMKNPLPIDIDEDFLGVPRAMSIDPPFNNRALRSHVLLAACGAEERAVEQEGKGRFTTALLKTLTRLGPEKITYYELMKRLPPSEIPGQNPQCEGRNHNRIIFSGMAPSHARKMYPIRRKSKETRDGVFLMRAGAAQGITTGSRYDVYQNMDDYTTNRARPLGSLVATFTDVFMTSVVVPEGAPALELGKEWGWAIQTSAGEGESLRVHIADDKRLIELFADLHAQLKSSGQEIVLVNRDDAELVMTLDDSSKVVFHITNQLCIQYGLTTMPFFDIQPTIGSIYPVIRSAARFYWHLRRSNTSSTTLYDKINIETFKLKEDGYDDAFRPNIMPEDESQNLNKANIVDLVVDDEAYYGYKITNKSDLPLYCSAFYFDMSDLSVELYYQPAIGPSNVDSPLQPGGSLTIGYGTGGGVPHQYFLRPNQNVDVGFVKFFITTHPADFRDVEQQTPFSVTEVDRSMNKRTAERSVATWDTIIVTVVQRRYPLNTGN